jgi:CheY-like chemotaxis protein
MSNFEIVVPGSPLPAGSYVVSCWKCAKAFDAGSAPWCRCDSKLRTLRCAHCSACFCQAPFAYRRKFWNEAPNTLREHTGRFRIVPSAPNAPAAEPSRDETVRPCDQPHVLVVDDEEPIRSLAACVVEQIGYRVTTASGPEEALLLTEQIAFDVVLTDALMPKMDGRELCRTLKETHGSRIKVILMTALYTARRFESEARNVFKADGYLPKPLRYDALRDALQRVAPLVRLSERSHAAARDIAVGE